MCLTGNLLHMVLKKYPVLLILIYYLMLPPLFAEEVPLLCSGPGALLAIADRPSVAYSACTVLDKNVQVESGSSYLIGTYNTYSTNLPQTEMRFGIINDSEIDVFLPNYIEQSRPPIAGSSATAIGLKHIFYSNKHNILTLQGYVSPPSGGKYYGTINTSFLLNGIYNYTFDSGLNITTSLGYAGNAAPSITPFPNYYTFNPIIDIGWSFTDSLTGYFEIYSQSKSAINQGWGVSSDGGFLYLLTSYISVDASFGHRIFGYLGNVNYYYSLGLIFSFAI